MKFNEIIKGLESDKDITIDTFIPNKGAGFHSIFHKTGWIQIPDAIVDIIKKNPDRDDLVFGQTGYDYRRNTRGKLEGVLIERTISVILLSNERNISKFKIENANELKNTQVSPRASLSDFFSNNVEDWELFDDDYTVEVMLERCKPSKVTPGFHIAAFDTWQGGYKYIKISDESLALFKKNPDYKFHFDLISNDMFPVNSDDMIRAFFQITTPEERAQIVPIICKAERLRKEIEDHRRKQEIAARRSGGHFNYDNVPDTPEPYEWGGLTGEEAREGSQNCD
ncbi:hypothetical protein [uncultured Lutibacter sp.]|uniref:hypothetical protein n=1 Tax=uncultured Lutibacter sp. TaxID=437739 RepID=UPI002633FA39|nr:hypothetical protein [uncultured Lutibacter sp.]